MKEITENEFLEAGEVMKKYKLQILELYNKTDETHIRNKTPREIYFKLDLKLIMSERLMDYLINYFIDTKLKDISQNEFIKSFLYAETIWNELCELKK